MLRRMADRRLERTALTIASRVTSRKASRDFLGGNVAETQVESEGPPTTHLGTAA